jgi:hypothetical protein
VLPFRNLLFTLTLASLTLTSAAAQSPTAPTPTPSAPPTIGTVKVKPYKITPDSVNRLNVAWKAALSQNKYGLDIWEILSAGHALSNTWTLSPDSKSRLDALLGQRGYDAFQMSFAFRTKNEPQAPIKGDGLDPSETDIRNGEIRIIMTGWKGDRPDEIAKLYVAPGKVLSPSQAAVLTDERFNNQKRIYNIGIVYNYNKRSNLIGCNVLVFNGLNAAQLAFAAHDRGDIWMTRQKRQDALLARPNKGLTLSKLQNIPPGFTDDYIVLENSADAVLLGENAVVLFNVANVALSGNLTAQSNGASVPELQPATSPTPLPTSAPEENSVITARVRQQFAALQSGNIDRHQYAKIASDELTDAKVSDLSILLKPFGQPTAVYYRGKREGGEDVTEYYYSFDFDQGTLAVALALDGADKISGLAIDPE